METDADANDRARMERLTQLATKIETAHRQFQALPIADSIFNQQQRPAPPHSMTAEASTAGHSNPSRTPPSLSASISLSSISSSPSSSSSSSSSSSLSQPLSKAPQVTSETVIATDSVARKVLSSMLDMNLVPVTWIPNLLLRMASPGAVTVKWDDLKLSASTHRSRLSLRKMLDCGVNITDLWRCGLARSYNDLKDTFSFSPTDLCVNYQLFNLARLRELFGVSYKELAIDFSVGVYEYLIHMRLSLGDIHSADIDVERMLNWEDAMVALFKERGHPDPRSRRSGDDRMQRFFSPLTMDLLMKRVRATQDALRDWTIFLGLTAGNLLTLGATKTQLLTMWGSAYKGSIDGIFDELGATQEERRAFRK